MFLIKLKLNNHHWKKYKINVLYKKNDARVNGFAIANKAPSTCEKLFLIKTSFRLICTGKIFKTVCGNFFKLNGSPDI